MVGSQGMLTKHPNVLIGGNENMKHCNFFHPSALFAETGWRILRMKIVGFETCEDSGCGKGGVVFLVGLNERVREVNVRSSGENIF